jgi:cytidylate kinase
MQGLRVIAIDGPAGTGKSTVARALADRLGLAHLDTGAMYRAVTFAAQQRGLAVDDEPAVAALARAVDLSLDAGRVVVDGIDATAAIRGPDVTAAVSTVAANTAVRAELVERQRRWAIDQGGGVLEGRDIGTVVFPDAELKVYLTASPAVRAARRVADPSGSGLGLPHRNEGPGAATVELAAVEADLARRDELDSSRADSPLAQADDAVVIDTSGLGPDEVVEAVLHELSKLAR